VLKKLFIYITPLTLLAAVLVYGMVYFTMPGNIHDDVGAAMPAFIMMLLLPVIIIDVLLRVFLRKQYHWVWLIEAFLFLGFCVIIVTR